MHIRSEKTNFAVLCFIVLMTCKAVSLTIALFTVSTKVSRVSYYPGASTVRDRKWSQDRKWSRTANDPQIGSQMIPDRKWSPYWTKNDPDQKIRNGMDGRIGWIGNCCTWIPIFFSLCLNARQPGKVLNELNARQSEIFTEFPLKDYLKFLDDIWCFLRNVERFQILCPFVRRRNNRACAYYEIGICLKLRKIYAYFHIGS